jgi:hypothetical protein
MNTLKRCGTLSAGVVEIHFKWSGNDYTIAPGTPHHLYVWNDTDAEDPERVTAAWPLPDDWRARLIVGEDT